MALMVSVAFFMVAALDHAPWIIESNWWDTTSWSCKGAGGKSPGGAVLSGGKKGGPVMSE